MSFPLLLSPVRLGGLSLRNRVVLPPMVTNFGTEDGAVTDRAVAHYARRARGGVGLIIVEAAAVEPDGRIYRNQLGLWSDEHVAGLRRLADAVHKEGALAAVQLHHAGRRSPYYLAKYGRPMVAPSPIAHPVVGIVPRALTIEGIQRLIRLFTESARRAREAGMDALEVHGAHGYLFHQFLSPLSNQRDDHYGGSPENRLRFIVETLRSIRSGDGAGPDFPLIYRLTADEFAGGGLTPEDTGPVALQIAEEGVGLIHVSGAGAFTLPPSPPVDWPFSTSVRLSSEIKGYIDRERENRQDRLDRTDGRDLSDVGVIAVGAIFRPGQAEDILRRSIADLVAVGRGLLADPDWVKKAAGASGTAEDITVCADCPKCEFRDAGCPWDRKR